MQTLKFQVPVYKENVMATCPSCSSLVFDLMRCSFCLRQLPKIKNLVTLQADSMYGISYGPVKPIFDPLPVSTDLIAMGKKFENNL